MAKNTGSSKFRKVDVDLYDEDRFYDEETDASEAGPNETEVYNLMAKDKYTEALQAVLNNAPVGSKDQGEKEKAILLVIKVLTSYKGNIDQAIKSLDSQKLDTLMKYIYKGFEYPSENSSATLLTWHQKAFAVGGLGSIMRVMTDRKTV